MRRRPYNCSYLLTAILFSSSTLFMQVVGVAQDPAAISVEGRVEAVYLSIKISEPTYVVQVLSQKVSPDPNSVRIVSRELPNPGDVLFVVYETDSRRPQLPAVGENIRAQISFTSSGKWQAMGTDWFEVLAAPSDNRSTAKDSDSPLVEVRGMSCEAKILSGQIAFEVKNVDPTGSARDAGFQIGDIITAVSGKPLPTVAALQDLATKSGTLELTVIDINTGRLAKVVLASAPSKQSPPPAKDQPANSDNVASATRITTALGISVIPSRIGVRKTAVAVSKVDPSSGGAEAGLEVGDVILGIDDQMVANADEFAAALPASGGTVTLLVRDSRSGDDVPVKAVCKKSGTIPKTQATQPTVKALPAGPPNELGLSTELAFYQAEAAVRVVSVQPGSSASRAGIQPGWIILGVNGRPVLHPDEFKKIVGESQIKIQLTVADPSTHRESELTISR